MCLAGTVVASWFPTQEVAVSSPFNEYNIFTARKRSLGQGNMFKGVCLSTGGCLLLGGCLVWGVSAQRVPGLGGLVQWGLGQRGVVQGGACSGRGCMVETPRMATAADGTHPAGMHSCLSLNSANSRKTFRENSIDADAWCE